MRGRLFLVAMALTVVSSSPVWAGGDAKNMAIHAGGTMGLFSGMPGSISVDAEKVTFKPMSNALTVQIPFASLTAIEYGSQPGQRVAVAVLASKNKNAQYLTLNWLDGDKEQAIVFELTKDAVTPTLAGLEKSGKEIQYQGEAARHASR